MDQGFPSSSRGPHASDRLEPAQALCVHHGFGEGPLTTHCCHLPRAKREPRQGGDAGAQEQAAADRRCVPATFLPETAAPLPSSRSIFCWRRGVSWFTLEGFFRRAVHRFQSGSARTRCLGLMHRLVRDAMMTIPVRGSPTVWHPRCLEPHLRSGT